MLRPLRSQSFITTLLLALFIAGCLSAAPSKIVGTWEVLEGCRLKKNPYANDGDSFYVRHDGEEYIFRLYFVDALETRDDYMDRVRDQARYFSILEDDVIPSGEAATKYTNSLLRGEFTVITKWEDARGNSKLPRHYALVLKDDEYLSTKLVENGLARIYGMPTRSKWPGGVTTRTYLSRLKNAERVAQRAGKGIWAIASGSIQAEQLAKLGTDVELEASESDTSTNPISSSLMGDQQIAPNLPDAGGLINVNTASAEELDTLPGIGPALAARIIAARPFDAIEALADISGISLSTVESFRTQIIVKAPPPPPNTVSFYLADLETYLNQEIALQIETVLP
ncbi:MAG: helix-hairpin-helix domain-containing protein, partial [Verrucomicrobiota bacterium]